MCMHDQILCMTDDEWRSIVKQYMGDWHLIKHMDDKTMK
jgi:hypothetical protein